MKGKKSHRQMKAIHAKKRKKHEDKNVDGSQARGFYTKNESLL